MLGVQFLAHPEPALHVMSADRGPLTPDHQTVADLCTMKLTPHARYAYCPNLTIIDTPGFILKAKNGEQDRTPEDILTMVKAQAAPAHRQARMGGWAGYCQTGG